jgi:hypothetical protein
MSTEQIATEPGLQDVDLKAAYEADQIHEIDHSQFEDEDPNRDLELIAQATEAAQLLDPLEFRLTLPKDYSAEYTLGRYVT